MRDHRLIRLFSLLFYLCIFAPGPMPGQEAMRGTIAVVNRKTITADKIDCERIALGEPDDYKPNLILLPNGELLLVMFQNLSVGGGKVREDMTFHRSSDGGRTWGKRQVMPLLGREPYFSVLRDGTLFITTHLLADDIRNTEGYIHSYVHRSTDAGKSWTTLRIGAEDVPGAAKKTWTHTSRNVLELQDDTLILGVSAGSSTDYLWRSMDKGKTWDKSLACKVTGFEVKKQGFPWHAETVFWQASNGDILAIARCFSGALPRLGGTDIPKGDDSVERMAVFRTRDGGRNWALEPELGSYYGEHYQAVLRLQDKRLLLTFTVRGLRPPLGLQAVLGEEKVDGFVFDFKTDRLVLDQKTPANKPSGGGFGNTIQLKDGSLVSVCSYRGQNDKTHVEVIRWQLPQVPKGVERRSFLVEPGVRQLFLDDVGVEKIGGLKHTMHQPKKRGAVIRSSNPEQTIQTRTAPVWDSTSKLFKFWVLGIDDCLWQSRDGLHWAPGPKTNMRTDMAVYDPLDPDPSRRFKSVLLNEGFAVSADGAQWTKLAVPKISSSDEGNFSYDPKHGLFIHTVKRGGPNGRSVAISTSKDFKTWTDYGVVFHADKLDQELGRKNIETRRLDHSLQQTRHDDPKVYNVDVYNMGMFHYEGLYIGMPALYHATGPVPNYPNTDGFHLVQLACSRDLKVWRRLGDRQPFLAPSRRDSGAYDLTQILPPSAPVVRNDELWFYYTGLKYRASWKYIGKFPEGKHIPLPGLDRDAGGVCLAVLRRDGFVSVDAGDKAGTLLTKPFALPAGTLHVNADTMEGMLQVAVCDEQGLPIKGFEQSQEIRSDKVAVSVTWGDANLERLRGRNVRLQFTLQNGKLFSYWFGETK